MTLLTVISSSPSGDAGAFCGIMFGILAGVWLGCMIADVLF